MTLGHKQAFFIQPTKTDNKKARADNQPDCFLFPFFDLSRSPGCFTPEKLPFSGDPAGLIRRNTGPATKKPVLTISRTASFLLCLARRAGIPSTRRTDSGISFIKRNQAALSMCFSSWTIYVCKRNYLCGWCFISDSFFYTASPPFLSVVSM